MKFCERENSGGHKEDQAKPIYGNRIYSTYHNMCF